MAGRRGRVNERESPNPRPRQQSRNSGPETRQTASPEPSAQSQGTQGRSTPPPAPSQPTPAPSTQATGGQPVDNFAMQQLLLYLHQQQQMFQAQMQAQMQQTQAQMQQTHIQFEQMLLSQGGSRKKDPPVYEGKLSEDLELWIFATEEYYAAKRGLMEANSSDFVKMISSNLGKSVLNWYRTFSTQCETEGRHKTWALFKNQLRVRFRPRDFEYNLRERLFDLKQTGTIHEYVSKFQDLLSQTDLTISEMEKRFYFQNGLRSETAIRVKEMSPTTLLEVIEHTTNFEFAHFSGKPPKPPTQRNATKSHNPFTSNSTKPKYQKKSVQKIGQVAHKNDWKKEAICNKCGIKGHIAPECKKKEVDKEANRYMSGSFYAILEVQALAYQDPAKKKNVSIFIDNGCSLNSISEDIAQVLGLTVHEDVNDTMNVDLGFSQTVQRPRRTAEMALEVPGFPPMTTTFQVMPIPEDKDTLKLSPRAKSDETPLVLKTPTNCPARFVKNRRRACHGQSRDIFNFYRVHGHNGEHGHTKFVSMKRLAKELRKGDVECVFVVNPHDSEKAARFKQQGWEALHDNPAFDVLWKYKDTVFRTELPNTTPPVREGIEHEIKLKPGTKPISVPQWRQSPEQWNVIQEWTQEMAKAGIIRPSTSPFSAPTFCVKKPVGWRIVHDYRQLNASTVLPAIPIPRKEDTFDAMSGSYWFSCMDLLWGYYQVKLREQDIPFTAFSTPDGLFEYLVTPMGLRGSPGTFNRLLQRVFSDLRDVMRIYFDDIYVFTKSTNVQKHLEALDRVLHRCEVQQLYIKLSKCQFCVGEIPCLGDFVGRNGVRMDPDKIKIVQEWPVPKTKKQMESFLGTTVYVSRFCKDFAQFAGPLHDVIKGKKPNERLELSHHQLACFEQLKVRLSSPPVLKLPDFSQPFGIRMDASNFAIGGVLFQKEGELEHPIAYTGRKMKSAELNYPVREQELLAIMHATKVWRVYLLDRPFVVETDHKSIETILTQKTTNRRVARWFNELAEFQPQFKWIPGHTNDVADALSRNPDFEHKAATVNLEDLLKAAANREVVATINASPVSVEETAKKMYKSDRRTQEILEHINKGRQVSKYSVVDGLLLYQTREDEEPRLVIPEIEDLKNRVIYENHDVLTASHPGYYKTYLAVQKKYYWPRMIKYIQRYVNTCLLNPLSIPSGRWVEISMDFLVSLPKTNEGHDVILVIVDRLTKRAKFIATKTTATAEDTADLFMKCYMKDHGQPKSIVSDRDSKFTSKFWTSIMTTTKTQHNLSSAFRPQTDGQTERRNRFIEDYLRGVVNPAQNDWNDFLHTAEFAYNRRVHSTIGMSPFEADLGYNPYIPDDVAADPEFKKLNKAAQDFLFHQEVFLRKAQDAMSEAQERMKSYYDKNRKQQNFEIGPYPIVNKVHKDSYEIAMSKDLKIHPIFYTSLLKPYQKDDKRKQQTSKVLLANSASEGQLVQAFIDYRTRQGKEEYKIHWLGLIEEYRNSKKEDLLLKGGRVTESAANQRGRRTRVSK
ncbi:Retrovirus polyprotein, partial [Globisporangium splendens]